MKARLLASLATLSLLALQGLPAGAQVKTTDPKGAKPAVTAAPQKNEASPAAKPFDGLKLRAIGPALMSGRIADIAIDPTNPSTWYVAVGSGGVWKTVNAGTTWTPLFDKEASYSIGCVTIDPSNPHVIWVGTGENVGGRHVGFGDGVYRSRDAGASWENLGLKDSQHISKILVHPTKPEVVWVAAQGPLWSKGGDRGLFKTTDGGKTWTKVLGAGEWTGVTDVAIDPRNPDVLYAATWQRHRTVAGYMGGGPESGIHRSTDGGATWEKLKKGLPEGPLGKIGLAVSPQNPDVLYAAIETNRRTGAVYRSTDRGSSWEKRSETVSGATGPHYYQELYASPHAEGRIYLVDVRMQVSDDGGKTFRRVEEKDKHSDNHAIAFRKDDPDYLLVGTDGGIYESLDLAKTWRFVANLPVTQFYKIAVDDDAPFYNVYGGTQDNSTQGGPSRTDSVQRHPERRLVHHPLRRRLPAGHRARQPRHPVLRVAAGEPRARGPHDRRAGLHPAPARAGRPRRALQLGRADPREPALAEAALLRLAARVALRRPGRQLARGLGRPHPQPGPHDAAPSWAGSGAGTRRGT